MMPNSIRFRPSVGACPAPILNRPRPTHVIAFSREAVYWEADWRADPRDIVVAGVPSLTQQREIVFYDGHCGLCHRGVKFVLKHDRSGTAFRFAPLQGETFQTRVPVDQRANLPKSLVVQTRDGSLLMRSNAWIHILRRLGGGWKVVAAFMAVIPRPLRDVVYDFVARIRYRVFGRRDDLCPVVPPDLRARFDP
jgi:predicted DCC family thiol-disulfide oxidoreductase YuxK